MSKARRIKPSDPCDWQYHPRSDHHSKVACWGVLFDLLVNSDLIRNHAATGKIGFGINHVLVDHRSNRKKALDLVICRPRIADGTVPSKKGQRKPRTFDELAKKFGLILTDLEAKQLAALPTLTEAPVGTVLVALEAKAAMTEFGKARPRLYDELESSHVVVHGDTDSAIALGLALINGSLDFISPTKNPCISYGAPHVTSKHNQPKETLLTIEKIRSLPRRTAERTPGFDSIAAVVVQCRNDGKTPVTIESRETHGALPDNDVLNYSTLINRANGIYSSRFPQA